MLIKSSDTIVAQNGRKWHVRDGYTYSREEGLYDVILTDERGEPVKKVQVESLDDLDKFLTKAPDKPMAREPGADRPWTVQLPESGEPKQRWDIAIVSIRPNWETVFVEMDEYREAIAGILLTDTHRGVLRPDSGVVLCMNAEGEIGAGDHVLLRPYGGNEFAGFAAGSYEARGRVKIYGAASNDPYVVEREDWRESIMGFIDHVGGQQHLRACEDWCLIRRDPVVTSEGGVALVAKDQYRNQKATVWSAGATSGYNAGQRVMYHGPAAMFDLAFDQGEFNLEGDPGDYVFIKAGNLYGAINE